MKAPKNLERKKGTTNVWVKSWPGVCKKRFPGRVKLWGRLNQGGTGGLRVPAMFKTLGVGKRIGKRGRGG